MNFRTLTASVALATIAIPAGAMADEAGMVAAAPVAPAAITLPANTPVELTLNSQLTTKANATGDKFSMTLAQDVLANGEIVIPKGTRAIGQVTFAKGNGSFGKSGKIELMFRYLELNGTQIPLDGTYYQEGNGNTAATLGAIAVTGLVGGLVVKGHSAEIVAGKDFSATIKGDVPFVKINGAVALDTSFRPEPVSMQVESEKERKKRLKAANK